MAEEARGGTRLFAEETMKHVKPQLARLDFGNLFNNRWYLGPLVKRALSAPRGEVEQALSEWEKRAAAQREMAAKTQGEALAIQLRTEAKNLDLLRGKVREIVDNPKKMREWLRQAYAQGEEVARKGGVEGLLRKRVEARNAEEAEEERRHREDERLAASKRGLLISHGLRHLEEDTELMGRPYRDFVKRISIISREAKMKAAAEARERKAAERTARAKENELKSRGWKEKPKQLRQALLDGAGLGHLRENPQILRMPILAFKSRVNTIAKADAQKVATAEHFSPEIHGRALYGMFEALMKKRRGRR